MDWLDEMRKDQDVTLKAIRDGGCGCHACIQARGHRAMHMVVCKQCGNKRCPHANNHELPCTNSNEAGQRGSAYQ